MENQTAVQWLKDMLKNMVNHGGDLGQDYPAVKKHIEQALIMEKTQTINFHNWMKANDTEENADKFFHFTDEDMLDEYYKELDKQAKTFGGS